MIDRARISFDTVDVLNYVTQANYEVKMEDKVAKNRMERKLAELSDTFAALRVAREHANNATKLATTTGASRETVIAAIGELAALLVSVDRVAAAQRRVDNE